MSKKICPFRNITINASPREWTQIKPPECLEEHCGVWCEADKKCSIPVIARNLELIDCRIDSLVGVVDRK